MLLYVRRMPKPKRAQFLGVDVWSTIGKCLDGRPTTVVIAYVTEGARRLLKLSAGDVLITDASLYAVMHGQTDPRVLLEFQRKGVRVYNYPGLHAKVIVQRDCAIIGSANASTHSSDTLLEACAIVYESGFVASVRAWAEALKLDELGPKHLQALAKQYRRPRFVPGKRSDSARGFNRLWIVSIHSMTRRFDEQTEKWEESQTRTLKKRVRTGFDVDEFHLLPGRIQRNLGVGDQLIWVDRSEGRTYGICRVIKVERRQPQGSAARYFYWVEYDPGHEITNSRFFAKAESFGLQRLTEKSCRLVRDDAQAQKLRAYFEGFS